VKPKKQKFIGSSTFKQCMHSRCKAKAVIEGYCRLHYIANWKTIRFNKKVKAEQKLNSYVDKLIKKYPKDFLEKIKESLESEDKFKEAMEEFDIEADFESTETDREFLEKFIRNIKPDE